MGGLENGGIYSRCGPDSPCIASLQCSGGAWNYSGGVCLCPEGQFPTGSTQGNTCLPYASHGDLCPLTSTMSRCAVPYVCRKPVSGVRTCLCPYGQKNSDLGCIHGKSSYDKDYFGATESQFIAIMVGAFLGAFFILCICCFCISGYSRSRSRKQRGRMYYEAAVHEAACTNTAPPITSRNVPLSGPTPAPYGMSEPHLCAAQNVYSPDPGIALAEMSSLQEKSPVGPQPAYNPYLDNQQSTSGASNALASAPLLPDTARTVADVPPPPYDECV